jgi:hypothetical protein
VILARAILERCAAACVALWPRPSHTRERQRTRRADNDGDSDGHPMREERWRRQGVDQVIREEAEPHASDTYARSVRLICCREFEVEWRAYQRGGS